MKIAYFDAPSGLAGNMILGALLDAGLDKDYLQSELNKLPITNYQLLVTHKKKYDLRGTYFNVKAKETEHHRNIASIRSIINKSRLSQQVKALSLKIFHRLAEAEAKAHGLPIEQVHFHEVGAVDAIIDIVGSCIGLEKLGVEKIYCSPLPFGQGKIKHVHGLLPNPAPATVELLKGVPVYGTKLKAELVTPTGAAIMSTVAEFSDLPRIKLEKLGNGVGSFDLPIPNILRVYLGESEIQTTKEAILQIEANIDDMAQPALHKAVNRLMKIGALDAQLSRIIMKKGRTAFRLIVLGQPQQKEKLLTELFRSTTTLGARTFLVSREVLGRRWDKIKTKFGTAKIKLGLLGAEVTTIAPEYENYRRLAAKHAQPIAKVYQAVKKAAVNAFPRP